MNRLLIIWVICGIFCYTIYPILKRLIQDGRNEDSFKVALYLASLMSAGILGFYALVLWGDSLK